METSWSYKLRMAITLLVLFSSSCLFAAIGCTPVTIYLAYALVTPEFPASPVVAGAGLLYGLFITASFLFAGRADGIDFLGILADDVSADEMSEVHRIVTRYASQVDVPVPRIAFVKTEEPIAFTTGGWGESKITFSSGLREKLTESEFRAVLAHEVAHVANRDATVMTIALAPTWYLAENDSQSQEITPFDERKATTPGWLQTLVGTLIGHFSREREFAADRGAVAITGDAASLVSALETLSGVDQTKTDLRARTEIAALSVVEPTNWMMSHYFAEKRGGRFDGLYRRLERWTRTHPPVEERRRRLLELDPDAIRANEKPSA